METLYDPNGPVTLANTTIKLKDGPSSRAKVVLRLSPVPTIHFDPLEPSPEFKWALFDAFIARDPTVIELPSGAKVEMVDVGKSLIPTSEPVTALDTGKPLHEVRFGVINFPDFMKPRPTESQTDVETPWNVEKLWTIQLKGDPWLVEIKPVVNREQVHKFLRQQRGFAITHSATANRSDGKPFSSQSVRSLLATINQFVSFARGVSCGITLINGLDETGKTVWEEWSVTKVQPWKGYKSCLDTHNGATLEELFKGFWGYFQTHSWDSQIYPPLEWYLESNAQEASHTSIVLNQAALERLSVEAVGGRAKEEKRGDWIAKALRKVTDDVEVPQSLRESLGQAKPFAHGPHALVEIRNDLVHARMKNGIPSSKAQRQARQLGLWYIELLLLRRFGYNGVYSNRLSREWAGDVEKVPWASPS